MTWKENDEDKIEIIIDNSAPIIYYYQFADNDTIVLTTQGSSISFTLIRLD